MKHLFRTIILVCMVFAGRFAIAQQSSLLAACIGEPIASYGKAFQDTSTFVKSTPNGKFTVGQYKTGSAMIEVMQKVGTVKPSAVNVFYYQEPKRDWKLAFKDIGFSIVGVAAKEDAKHHIHLTHIKAGKLSHIEAEYIPLGPENSDGPELHLLLK